MKLIVTLNIQSFMRKACGLCDYRENINSKQSNNRKVKIFISTIIVLLLFIGCQPKLNGISTEIHFDHDSTNMSKENLNSLVAIIQFCKQDSNIHLDVTGFSDTIGTDEFNMEMSKLRSLKVYNYIMDQSNLNKANTAVHWYGESDVLDETQEGKLKEPQNRVVVSIQIPDGIKLNLDGSR